MNISLANFLTILFCVAQLVGAEIKILDSKRSRSHYQPENAMLEEHPESITLDEKGERGIILNPSSFKGFGLAINPGQPER